MIGPVILRPSGFLESTAVIRSTGTADDVSTRFGSIPLADNWMQALVSERHSRAVLHSQIPLGAGVKVSGFMETDFLSRAPANPFRWRQYWGKIEAGGWEVLAGHAWSLLRPNRAGIMAESQLMNTRAVDAGYHVGLLGYRTRQIRAVRHFGAWHAGVSYENGKDFLPKLAHDSKRLHWELIGVAGAGQHRGLSGAATVHATKKVDIVTQQFWSRGGGRDALSTVPARVKLFSTLEGVEAKVARGTQVFAYAGLVYGERSAGNRLVTEYTAGFSRDLLNARRFGNSVASVQVSRIGRDTWTGAAGRQNVVMISVRHYIGVQ